MADHAIADLPTRDEIRTALDETLFVEAGAGSGKTTALVERVLALVCDAGVPMARIAAITFTEKAATELRDRVRQALERVATDPAPGTDPARIERAAAAIDEVDGAAVSTLHAFAQRLLHDCPIEAGLPPHFDVHDELSSQVTFDDRWSEFVDQLLGDSALERTVMLGTAAGVDLRKLRELAIVANANWDLVERERLHELDDEPPPLDATRLVDAIAAVGARVHHCTVDDDKLAARIADIEAFGERLRKAPDEYEALTLLKECPISFKVARTGKSGSWGCDINEVRAEVVALDECRGEIIDEVATAVARRLLGAIATFTLASAAERERAGTLEFHDLLVLARRMLRDPEHGTEVRARLRERYARLLLDEFQDTDPIQLDLALLLATPPAAGPAVAWSDLEPDPGHLFVVGDPKQSIYRFRRADIALFLAARDRLGRPTRRLTSNFRTVTPVIEWVNHVFGTLIEAAPDSQPEYVALHPVRPAPPSGPAVTLLGVAPHAPKTSADEQRTAEAADVAAVVRTAIADEWPVAETVHDADGTRREVWRPARLGDIAILLPARTSLGHLEDALDALSIPYRAETSSLVYATREIRDLLVLLRAVDDPTDELAVVTALRSALLGCGDDDLFVYRVQHGGSWHPFSPRPEGLPADHPVVAGLDVLRRLGDEKHWCTPSQLLDQIVRERRVLEVADVSGRPRDVWRRVRYVIDQARAFGEAEGGSLRDFLAWAERQGDEGSRVVETVLPETDDDAVRILTIHGAKGLEFPITILSGMTTKAVRRPGGVRLVFPPGGGWALRIDKEIRSEDYERFEPVDEQMDFHEKLRLLYVGATRARDHLVVSLHRAEREPGDDPAKWTHAELLGSAGLLAPHATPFVASAAIAPEPPATRAIVAVPPRDEWAAARTRALDEGRVPRVQSATRIAREAAERAAAATAEIDAPDPGMAKEPRDLELPPWQRGRYGTAIGRAVHAVLQTIDLRTGAGIPEAAAAQAAAEGVLGHEDRIAALARSALATATVADAVAHEFRRETLVATTLGDRTLEGYVDLLYRTPHGIVVVDYKTDAVHGDDDLDAKLARYRLQGAAYAVAVAAATGEPVVRCVFLFLDPAGARERAVDDLDAAMAEVRALL
ncbi:MAG TPA: UvrD-helicase domain-containing protein [Acidimicrobiia bacterium]|nr:UvrD-helicase domain-containing protein [Acidimicrobiia bacterium]